MSANIDDWNDLRAFLAVVREGTLARAADALGLNASTVFRRLGNLEAALETRLVERRGRGYVLTDAGERLAERVARVEDEVLGAARAVAGQDREIEGLIRLTTPDTLAVRLLGPIVAGFRAAYPRVSVDLLVGNRFFVLGRGEADVALRPGAKPTEGDVIAKHVGDIGAALYASADYLARRGRPRRRVDVAKHDLVAVDESLSHLPIAVYLRDLAPDTAPAVRCSSVLAQATAVEHGLGIAVLPCFLADGVDGVVRLFAPEPSLQTSLWLVVHRELRRVARVRALVDYLEAAIDERSAVLVGSG